MSSQQTTVTTSHPTNGKRTLQRLRREAGYRSAKEFARTLDIPAPTYARYERQPESPECKIPMGAAWRIADILGCSIDVVVGRISDDQEREGNIQSFYDSLSESSRSRMDEYMSFIEYRERMIEAQGRWQ